MNEPWEFPGWVELPEQVEEIAALQPVASFGATEAGQDETPLPSQVFLWEIARKITGGLLPPRNQGRVGSCVAFGTARAVEYTMLAEIAAGQPEQFRDIATEPIYGGSRVEVGRGRIRGDGSIGAWAAQWVKQWGIIPRGVIGSFDLSAYSETRCRQWGSSGVPDELEPIARKHPIQSITKVTTWEQAKRALANGFGIAICSNQGFALRRGEDGFAAASGRWAHCMTLAGYQTGRREGGRIDNSWGPQTHTGPVGAGNPGPEGFWADASVIDRMLAYGDSWAFSAFQGFPKQLDKIDWSSIG